MLSLASQPPPAAANPLPGTAEPPLRVATPCAFKARTRQVFVPVVLRLGTAAWRCGSIAGVRARRAHSFLRRGRGTAVPLPRKRIRGGRVLALRAAGRTKTPSNPLAPNPLAARREAEVQARPERSALSEEREVKMNSYEAKQEAKRERLEAAAERAEARSTEAYRRADMSEENTGIPFGQPILVGHHSERRHRAAIARGDAAMRRSIEESKKAAHYRGRAASVGQGGISSDDPEAVTKLREKLEQAETRQTFMKAANAALRKNDDDTLRALGLTDAQIEGLKKPDFANRTGFAAFQLTNNNANIRRMRKRIAQLEKASEAEDSEAEYDGFKVVENTEENRVQFLFDDKPSAAIRDILKGQSFRWSRSNEAWQRQLNNAGRYAAKCAVAQIAALNGEG